MMLFPLFVALVIIIILSFLLPKAKRSGKNILPPGPLGLPFIGNLHQYDSLTPHLYFWKLSQKYGKIFLLKLGSSTMIVVSSANLAKEVMKTQDLAFCSRPSLLGQQKLSYNGQDIAMSPYNDYWKEIRKICVAHLFSLKKVQYFSPIREDEVSRMIKKISQQAATSQITNLSNIVISLSTTIICRIAFDIRYDGETREGRKFVELLKVGQEMLAYFFVSDYFPLLGWIDKLSGKINKLEKNFKDLDELYEGLIEQHLNPNRPKSMEGDIIDPLLQLKKEKSTPIDLTLDNIKAIIMDLVVDWYFYLFWCTRLETAGPGGYDEEAHERRRFDELLIATQAMMASFFVYDFFPSLSWIDKLTGLTDRLENNFKNLDNFYEELIEQHLNPKRPKSMEGDILDLLLQLKKEKSTTIDLTLEDAKALAMDVLVAGSDTSAAVIVWAMTTLMRNPRAMKKVQAEIRQSIGKKVIVNEDDIQNMPYLKAVIKETLRLYPSAPLLLPRESMKKSILEEYEIESGTTIYVNFWAIARDPEIWENSNEFIPERFLNNDIDFKGQNFELIPFGAGRRGCPAITLGVAIVELALSNLLYAFDWKLPWSMRKEDIDTTVRPGIVMHKKIDLCLIPTNYL
ncbi:hypothetical protein MTR67_041777 [Solanum verrucosum]|uniref:Cytochrome P450 n=1 Tax=Solanum verrucosum TaxID=315347 RepID=A0AAF0ZQK9_SOLVR|nr:hypothetical protein MTR67_041777 [Solanum verrucosum]